MNKEAIIVTNDAGKEALYIDGQLRYESDNITIHKVFEELDIKFAILNSDIGDEYKFPKDLKEVTTYVKALNDDDE